jgi:hypothetical protein
LKKEGRHVITEIKHLGECIILDKYDPRADFKEYVLLITSKKWESLYFQFPEQQTMNKFIEIYNSMKNEIEEEPKGEHKGKPKEESKEKYQGELQ